MTDVTTKLEPELRRHPVIRIKRKWRQYNVGDVVGEDGKFDPAIAHTLVRTGVAEYVDGEPISGKPKRATRKKANVNAHRKATQTKKGGDPKTANKKTAKKTPSRKGTTKRKASRCRSTVGR